MATTLTQAVSILQRTIGDRGATSTTECIRFLNMAQRDVCRARDWPELMKRDFIVATAPYETGTVSLTKGSATVTGSGTTFASGMVGRKFALGYQSPWYIVGSFSSTTSIDLADSYAEASGSGLSYVIYEDRISMPSDCEKLYEVWFHDTNNRHPMKRRPPERFHLYAGQPGSADEPWWYSIIERDSNGYMQIQVGPYAPSDAYRLEVAYKKAPTELVSSSQESFTVSERLVDVVIQRALYWGSRRDDKGAARELSVYNEMLMEAWRDTSEGGGGFQIGMVSQPVQRGPGVTINYRSAEIDP